MNKYLKAITSLFPTWTKIYKDPENSEGGKFIKAFSIFLLNMENIIHDILNINNLSLNIIDYDGYQLSKIDFVGKTKIDRTIIDNAKNIWIIKDNKKIYISETTSTFLFFFEKEPLFFYDENDKMLYLNTITDLYIDGSKYTIEPHHIWGPYDEIGLLINCERQPLENNKIYAQRLRQAWSDFGNSSPEKLKRFIIRSLMPFESSLDNTIQLIELTDEYMEKMIKEEGLSDKLKSYIEQSKRINHNFDDSYWNIIETNNKGLKYLPISWNKSLSILNENDIQNGVLRKNDLEILAPELEEDAIQSNFELSVINETEEQNKVYKEQEFNYTISNRILTEGIKEQTVNLEVEQSENINLEFDLVAQMAYNTITSIFFTKEEVKDDENNVLTNTIRNYHVENDKEINTVLDIKELETNTSLDLIDSTEVVPSYDNDPNTLNLNIKLISENNSSPSLENISLIFNNEENGEYIHTIPLTTNQNLLSNINNLSFENEKVEIQDDIYTIDIDDYEITKGKKNNIKIVENEYGACGFSL